jgi:colicin import membrane protein
MNENRFSIPVTISVLLHIALLIVFLINWDFLGKKKEEVYPQHFVTATLVDLTPKAIAKPQQTKEQNLDAKNFEDLKNLKKQQEQKKKEAEAQEQKQKDQAAKEVADKAEKLKQQKQKDDQAKAAKAKAEAEQKKKAEAEKQKAEAELKKKREQEAQEEKRRQDAAKQLEEKHLADTADDASVMSYNELLARRVGENFNAPPSARLGMVSVFEIDMLPTGVVTGVRLVKSSGNQAFDTAAEQAIRRVERFVEIKNMPIDLFDRHFRHFTFTFDPKDLRL